MRRRPERRRRCRRARRTIGIPRVSWSGLLTSTSKWTETESLQTMVFSDFHVEIWVRNILQALLSFIGDLPQGSRHIPARAIWEERFCTPRPPGGNFSDCDCARIEAKASIHHPLFWVVVVVVVVGVYGIGLPTMAAGVRERSAPIVQALALPPGTFHGGLLRRSAFFADRR